MAEISRRALLGRGLLAAGAGIGALLGLTRTVHHRVAEPPAPPPAALTAALTGQRNLLAGYQQASLAEVPAGPALRVGRAGPRRRPVGTAGALPGLAAGRRRRARDPSSTATSPAGSGTPPATASALASASRTAAAGLAASCLHWPVGEPHAALVVPVLGSIAACLDSHVQVLSG